MWVKLGTNLSLPVLSHLREQTRHHSALLPAWESRGMIQGMPRGCLLPALAGAGAVGKPSACFCRCLVQTFTFLCRHHLVWSVCLSSSAVSSWEGRGWSQTTQWGATSAPSPKGDPKQGGLGSFSITRDSRGAKTAGLNTRYKSSCTLAPCLTSELLFGERYPSLSAEDGRMGWGFPEDDINKQRCSLLQTGENVTKGLHVSHQQTLPQQSHPGIPDTKPVLFFLSAFQNRQLKSLNWVI